jgi:desulfoferrodoxin-like iron-binding protein
MEALEMAVKKVGEKYRCNICGNEVVVNKVGGGTLVCCGEEMERIE